ncbi:asparagine synthase-related protein [Amycolatopsis sp. NPDC054798]
MSPTLATWFVVLPDTEGGLAVARTLRDKFGGASEIGHPSGRPWLVGNWPPGQLATGRSGTTALAVCGEHAVTATTLSEHAAKVRTIADVDTVHARTAGSVFIFASVDGAVRVQGTASGIRRVYRAVVDGVSVASDRAIVLAALTGSELEPARIAARLLFPALPWPLGWSSPWREVAAVRPGDCVVLDRQDSATERRWWRPPSADRPHEESVAALRTALTEAVAVRAPAGSRVVSHLSGLDSTSLCALAVRGGADVLAITSAQPDPMDDDVQWAGRTVAALRADGHRLRHELISAEESPLVYDNMLATDVLFDDPFLSLHNRSRIRCIVGRGAAHTSRMHLTGLGGDEMCTAMPTLLRSVARRHPVRGARLLRSAAARHRWPWRRIVPELVAGRSYPAWLRSVADELDRNGAGVSEPLLSWDMRPTLPVWASQDALRMAVAEIRRSATAEPALAADPGTHHALASIHLGSQAARGFQQLAAGLGVTLAAPFFDDRVLEVALSARAADRYDPGRYKPLLADAMRGVVPEATLRRTTKAETAASAVLGSREHRDQLVALAEDSVLGRLGLIDADRFLAACRGPVDVVVAQHRIEPTLCCEAWLRSSKEVTDVPLGA